MAGDRSLLDITRAVDQAEAETALKILNWYFDTRPDMYLIQKPQTVYDREGHPKTTVRYYMKQLEQEPEPK